MPLNSLFIMAAKKKKRLTGNILATNRKALRDYEVMERIEAGIVLYGTEVKSIREGKVSIDESYAKIERGEVYAVQLTIQPYEFGNRFNHEPARSRKLLLHRREIERLIGHTQRKGFTLIPLKMYLSKGKIKLEIGVCRGKNVVDKRHDIKSKAADMQARRAIAHFAR